MVEVLQEYTTQSMGRNLNDYQHFMNEIADGRIQIAGDEAFNHRYIATDELK